jgi:hypothetical protein
MTERDWYFDRAGQPISLNEWARLSGDVPYRFIARTGIYSLEGKNAFEMVECEPDAIEASAPHFHVIVITIWLGLDYDARDIPQIFETTAFRRTTAKGFPSMQLQPNLCFTTDNRFDQRSYATEAEALIGHRKMVVEVMTQLYIESVRING